MTDAVLVIAAVAGVGCCAWGAHLVYEPAGWITAGVLLLVGAVLGARRAS
ncbi:hypothetical protein [Plasticicumulans acidivorans]|uniref:Uncharacterized protein n=1 Tax=Plasticicumulans acidivorans TaxID=886464 RepID=A0A317N1K2_9GAMM|nr:hypothetical protein [Plasticicumulans acidivorans]PWV66010.1 hypothetical protein C7443_101498 [Plasticicumulans acidivorans]